MFEWGGGGGACAWGRSTCNFKSFAHSRAALLSIHLKLILTGTSVDTKNASESII